MEDKALLSHLYASLFRCWLSIFLITVQSPWEFSAFGKIRNVPGRHCSTSTDSHLSPVQYNPMPKWHVWGAYSDCLRRCGLETDAVTLEKECGVTGSERSDLICWPSSTWRHEWFQ